MLTKVKYSARELFSWTRYEILFFALYSTVATILYIVFDLFFFNIPWTPVALIGTAVAFIVGFQNNAAYGRIWEARKIWGAIVNTSRTWGMHIDSFVSNEHASKKLSDADLKQHKKTLIYRHIAWLTALRYAMRVQKPWEMFSKIKTNIEWQKKMCIPEITHPFEEAMAPYLSLDEKKYALSKSNIPTAILYLQSKHITDLKDKGHIWEFSFLELQKVLEELFTHQGKSERIKNFPYPRQYYTLSYYFVWIFNLLLPIALIPNFYDIGKSIVAQGIPLGSYFIWIAIPFCTIISWIFQTMKRIGTVGDNPFEGSANDVPISNISRTIEINLRQMLDENPQDIPEQFPEFSNIQM